MEYTKGEWRTCKSLNGKDNYQIQNKNTGEIFVAVFNNNIDDAHLIAAAPDMYEALKNIPQPKSLLAAAAYTGGDVPKKWINDGGNFIEGYNQALKDVAKLREQALSKAEGK